ncbi:MAG: hypothetical protein R3F43_26945 [bacterium]
MTGCCSNTSWSTTRRTTDDGTLEGRKRPQPDRVVGAPLRDLGPDPRAGATPTSIKNNRKRDDYDGIMASRGSSACPDPSFGRRPRTSSTWTSGSRPPRPPP